MKINSSDRDVAASEPERVIASRKGPRGPYRLMAVMALLVGGPMAVVLLRIGGPMMGIFAGAFGADAMAAPESARSERPFDYYPDPKPDIPLSIHVFKFDRTDPSFSLQTTLGGSNTIGKATIADQVKFLPAELGRPIAAVNGDFWYVQKEYLGDPMGLQISNGELISSPAGRLCFWIDPAGQPESTNVEALFKATWPDGASFAFGLNELRKDNEIVLYTDRVGPTTRTPDGVEVILERDGVKDWLPLRAGQLYSARVREVRRAGSSPVDANTAVLSFGPSVAARLPKTEPGAIIKLSTATSPSLAGAQVGLGASPTLVRDGRVMTWSGNQPRHPRTALGWNDRYFFLVEVDGRQRNFSIGMTFPELAEYMHELGCTHALNLDGGASATMWVLGTVVNRPSAGYDRLAANALVVVQKQVSRDP